MDKRGQTWRSIKDVRECHKNKCGPPAVVPKAVTMWKLTFHLHNDWLRLYHRGADTQSAAILPGIHPLHLVNAVIQYMRSVCVISLAHSVSPPYTPDSGEESCDPVRDGLELVDHHLQVCRKFLAVLHPDDGGFQPGVGDVDGAVEFGLVAL